MFSRNIEGIEILKKRLPEELQHWYKFSNVLEVHYWSEFINILPHYRNDFDDLYRDDVACMELLLTDRQHEYVIKMCLFNVTGLVSFDILNGFWSGLTIDDCYDWGYEKHCNFRISSFEQDIYFEFYCESIKVELFNPS